jgi:hypothetical protein
MTKASPGTNNCIVQQTDWRVSDHDIRLFLVLNTQYLVSTNLPRIYIPAHKIGAASDGMASSGIGRRYSLSTNV